MDNISERMFDQLWRLHDLNDENPEFMICGEAADQIRVLSDRIEKLEVENRWISVSEGLPEYSTTYLTDDHGMCEVLNYDAVINIWTDFDGFMTNTQYWRPLPEPPKGE